MLKHIVNRLRGQVRLRVECEFPERFLNLCSARGLAFWDLEWEGADGFSCTMNRRDYHALRRAAEALACTLTVLRREGAPYAFSRLRRRYVLLAGAVFGSLALFLGSFFIWDFRVEGNETVPTEKILRALAENGVKIGTFGLSLDGEDIRNHVLLDVPELSWITVNVSGCRAEVQVRERIFAPERMDRRSPANLVARRAGLVLEVQTHGGVACVLKGSSVAEGQLLISGVEENVFGARLLAGMGAVRARTWYELTAPVPLEVMEKRYTGEEKTALSLIFGTRRVKFFPNSSIEEAEYDKITQRYPLRLLGVPLPVTVETERYRFYETVRAAGNIASAEKAAGAALQAYLEELVTPYGEVKATQLSSRQRGNQLFVTLRAECEERIEKSVPIYTERTEESGEAPAE